MCRWLAYSGPPIYLEALIVKRSRSLLVQSRFARENHIVDIEGLPDGNFPINGALTDGDLDIREFRPRA